MESTSDVPSSGDLARTSPVHLYYLAAALDKTGLLTLQLQDRSIDIHFRKGSPEHVGSNHSEDSVSGFLLREQLATAQQIAQAEAARDQFGGDLIGAMFGLQILNPATAFSHLSRRASSILLRGLSAERGAFTFEAKQLPSQRAMPLGNRWSVLLEVIRRFSLPDLKRRLAPVLQLPVMKTGGLAQGEDLRLTPQEARALAFIDGVRSLEQLWKDFPAEAETYSRLVFVLKELELVSFAGRPPSTPPPPQIPKATVAPPPASSASAGASARPVRQRPLSAQTEAPPRLEHSAAPADPAPAPMVPPKIAAIAPSPPSPIIAQPTPESAHKAAPPASARTRAVSAALASPLVTAAQLEAELAELRKFSASLKGKNFYEVLGLTEKTDASAVKLAYFKLARSYHPDTVLPGAPPEFVQLKSDVFGIIGDAYRTLSDDKGRAQYLENLKTGGGEQVDISQILLADELFQRGTILVKARKFQEALRVLNDAVASNPDEAEFYAWRGFAKYFSLADKAQARTQAVQDLQLCLKKNDQVASAHYFLGQISKLSGDNPEAIRHFQRAVAIKSDYVDAQRELRLLTGKK